MTRPVGKQCQQNNHQVKIRTEHHLLAAASIRLKKQHTYIYHPPSCSPVKYTYLPTHSYPYSKAKPYRYHQRTVNDTLHGRKPGWAFIRRQQFKSCRCIIFMCQPGYCPEMRKLPKELDAEEQPSAVCNISVPKTGKPSYQTGQCPGDSAYQYRNRVHLF